MRIITNSDFAILLIYYHHRECESFCLAKNLIIEIIFHSNSRIPLLIIEVPIPNWVFPRVDQSESAKEHFFCRSMLKNGTN